MLVVLYGLTARNFPQTQFHFRTLDEFHSIAQSFWIKNLPPL